MKKIPFFKQNKDHTCGPATLQMVFSFYGKRVSEETLTVLLETTEGSGTDHQKLIEVTTNAGFYVYVNNDSSLEEIRHFLEKEIPIIVNFLEPEEDDGHYAVVTDITDIDVILNDPWYGEGFKMSQDEFLRRWKSSNGHNKKWIMAISDRDLNLGKQYLP